MGSVCKSTYCIFECVFTSDIVQFFNSEGGEIETTAMTLLNVPLVIILLIGCKIQSIKRKACISTFITGSTKSITIKGEVCNSSAASG